MGEYKQDEWPLERIRSHIASGIPLTEYFNMEIVEAGADFSLVRIKESQTVKRPGGSVAGPVLFAAGDVASYALILASRHDPDATTVDMTVNFLRPAMQLPLLARAEALRPGRNLFTIDVRISAEANPAKLLAQATTTWAMSR